jgi:hypothetical protein
MTAQAQGGPQAVQIVNQLRSRGVPEFVIRQRLGVGGISPEATMKPAAAAGRFGVMPGLAPSPPLPEELQRPYETLYPSDWESRVAAAAKMGTIGNEKAKQMMRDFEQWQQSPIGLQTAAQERARGVLESAGDIEKARVRADIQAAKTTQALLDQQRAQLEADANERRAWQEDYDREFSSKGAQLNSAIEEAKNARIDPKRASMGILDAIAIAGGEFARLYAGKGGPNTALDIVNARLDRDIAAQQAEIQGKKDVVAMRTNQLGLLRSRLGDREQAASALKKIQLESVQTQLQAIAVKREGTETGLRAKELSLKIKDQLDTMDEATKMGHAAASQELANQRAKARAASAYQLAKMREKQEAQQVMAAQGLYGYRPLGKEEAQRVVPGVGLALPGSKVDELRETTAQFNGSIRNLEVMERILSKYRGSDMIMSEDDKAAYRRASAQVDVPKINKVAGASMTEGEMARIAPMLAPEATNAIGRQRFDMEQQLAAYRNQLQSSFNETMGVHIERPVAVGYNPATQQREFMVSEGVAAPSQYRTGAGGATVLPGTAPPQ